MQMLQSLRLNLIMAILILVIHHQFPFRLFLKLFKLKSLLKIFHAIYNSKILRFFVSLKVD